ncbi:hypothetical protein HBI56_107050 [Parastagonospora nodorum]|nr:hypothetical protein HBH53_086800 [Parastagonospora nodorum]KAH3974577.1 hypothetical protein HBH52_134780 [Parastagonospora nodorum]KAH3977845.1 hypothetical protein HBH51_069080 [Parastagonospora nodorum]KAH3995989.1 hypothetical protein HBI10_165890 [Parastagonospora nodorum]KAH4021766.1 hypothetical protein HBI13_107140 [Parastagonospora nodorum]
MPILTPCPTRLPSANDEVATEPQLRHTHPLRLALSHAHQRASAMSIKSHLESHRPFPAATKKWTSLNVPHCCVLSRVTITVAQHHTRSTTPTRLHDGNTTPGRAIS